MPCTKGMARRVGDAPGSGCSAACLHRAKVDTYRWAREAYEQQREREAGRPGTTEWRDWTAANPGPVWRDWMPGEQPPGPEEVAGGDDR